MSDADGMPALTEHPAPRSTEQRLGVAPCWFIASAMSLIVRSAGGGIAGVTFAMVSDYIHSSDQKQRYWPLLKRSTDTVELHSRLMRLI
jgi:hypothetical protein